MNEDQIKNIIKIGEPRSHEESLEDINLGFGWFYYGIVKIYKPQVVVAIGSGGGFMPMCLAQGCKENGFGMVHFLDPSVGLTWRTPERVKERFDKVELNDWIKHYREYNYDFVKHWNQEIDILFIDGSDLEKDVKCDFYEIGKWVKKDGFILMHDTSHEIEKYHEWKLAKQLKLLPNEWDIIRFPGKAGFSIIRKLK